MKRIVFSMLLSFLSAILLTLPFTKNNLWVFAWIGFVPLFFAINGKNKLQAFFLSYITGILFFFGAIYWLIHVTLPGLIILVLYLGLYFGVFGLFVSTIRYPLNANRLLLTASFWVILEYTRNYIFTGFGWAILGYSQFQILPIVQIADITGVYGVSFLMILVNLAVFSFIRYKQRCLVVVLIILATLAYGYLRLGENINGKKLRISLVQGNISQDMKWDSVYGQFIKDKYISLTQKSLLGNPDLIIWPEASLPDILNWPEEIRQYLRGLGSQNLLIGALVYDNGQYYNSAVLITETKLQRYDKLHLVPFGEYIPLKNIFPFLETVVGVGDFTKGKEFTVFDFPAKFSALICFEDIFSNLARQFTKRGAEFLVNITNDAWFGDSSEPFQHMSFSVFRAIENRRFVVRAANTGISCFIDSKGKVYSRVNSKGKPTFVNGIDTAQVILLNKRTFYTKFGDLFILLSLLFLVASSYLFPEVRYAQLRQ